MKSMQKRALCILGGTAYGALLFLVFMGFSRLGPVKDALIRPDPSRAAAPSIVAERAPDKAGVTVPVDPAGPAFRTTAKHRRPPQKLDSIDPYTGEDLAAKLETAAAARSALEVDRRDPFDPAVEYPAVNMFTTPFDDSDLFADGDALPGQARRHHAKAARHAHAPPAAHSARNAL
jgi:hypothetical protein